MHFLARNLLILLAHPDPKAIPVRRGLPGFLALRVLRVRKDQRKAYRARQAHKAHKARKDHKARRASRARQAHKDHKANKAHKARRVFQERPALLAQRALIPPYQDPKVIKEPQAIQARKGRLATLAVLEPQARKGHQDQ